MAGFELTAKQAQANEVLASPAQHILLYGGSRSGKTFLAVRAIIIRALKAPGSRHAIMRYRFNAVKASVALDTFPKVMSLCFPEVEYKVNREDWYADLYGSQVWFAGLDDKERTEKILGQEFATLFLNECSQIPWDSRNLAITRLAQSASMNISGLAPSPLPLKVYYDCNPPDRSHWTFRLFVQKLDPETRLPIRDTERYAALQVNPSDNLANLPDSYMDTLRGLSARMQRRFLAGEFRESNPNALFAEEHLDRWRVIDGKLPDMQRIVIAVDPSGSGDTDNQDNDAIGIIVAGLGTDGNAYVLEDLTVKAGPATWGKVVGTAFDRHGADLVVAEINYGGAMVNQVIQSARPRTPYREVKASRGKVVRAEPISPLTEDGRIRMVGNYPALEDELAGFTTGGYLGDRSPNRADAFVWAMHELFPGIIRGEKRAEKRQYVEPNVGWMGA
jgi:predicted phage terminase large subunit-like protein